MAGKTGPHLVDRTCNTCGNPFRALNSEVRRGFGLVCSIACRNPARDTLLALLTNYIPVTGSGCWLWLGPIDNNGYGILTTPTGKRKAHRWSLLLHRPWPKDQLEACHRCDVPSCINPDHLFWGTHAENMADAKAKGRTRNKPRLGVDHPKAKLTEADVLAIRSMSESSTVIADHYSITPSTVRHIRSRNSWRHLP